ncbi:MAG: hypothetical protein ABI867_03485 [Kofleriaceae bacterium]
MSTAPCAFCDAVNPISSMEMTGHGFRCVQCTARAALASVDNPRHEMAEHLTRPELEGVVAAGLKEAVLGALLGIGALAGTAASFAFSARLVVICSGAALTGFAMLGHGLYRRRTALAAIRSAPDARVIRG